MGYLQALNFKGFEATNRDIMSKLTRIIESERLRPEKTLEDKDGAINENESNNRVAIHSQMNG